MHWAEADAINPRLQLRYNRLLVLVSGVELFKYGVGLQTKQLHIWTQKNMPNKEYICKSKFFYAFSSRVGQAGLAGSVSNQPGFRQTTSDLQRKLTTCTSIILQAFVTNN